MSAIERILVRLPNWLGDALMARPMLHAVRAAHPRAIVEAVGPQPLLELLAGDGVIDRARPTGTPAAAGAAPPDAALVLPPSFSSAWFAFRSGARLRIGYRHDARGPLLTHALRRPARGDLHLSGEYLRLAEVLGARAVPLPALVPAAAGVGAAEELLARHGIGDGPLALLGPGAIYGPAKRWAADRFAALGRRLEARGLRVLVCGGAAERAACAEVAAGVGGGARVLAGETDLATQAALCARAAVTVCNDSGLAHLAGAVGAPTVVIFGSTSSAWTAPLGARVRVVQRAPVCAPCFQRTCRIGTVCLSAIAVEAVARACEEVAA